MLQGLRRTEKGEGEAKETPKIKEALPPKVYAVPGTSDGSIQRRCSLRCALTFRICPSLNGSSSSAASGLGDIEMGS